MTARELIEWLESANRNRDIMDYTIWVPCNSVAEEELIDGAVDHVAGTVTFWS